jgi:hypothetical protein
MKVYIAGKMTGLPDNGHGAFAAAAATLRGLGFHVESPHENTPPECGTWLGWMRKSIPQLLSADAVVLLPNWTDSRGARAEKNLAQDLGLPIYTLEFLLSDMEGITA